MPIGPTTRHIEILLPSGTAAGATLSGGGGLAATGVRTVVGGAALSGGGSLATTGVRTVVGSGTLSGGGAIAATARVTGAATLPGGGTISAAGVRVTFGEATLTGTGNLSVAPVPFDPSLLGTPHAGHAARIRPGRPARPIAARRGSGRVGKATVGT